MNAMSEAGESADLAERAVLARRLRDAGKLAEAGHLYAEILREAPDDIEALLGFGTVVLASGDTRRALPLLERAVSLAPELAATHATLGIALKRAGRGGEAIAAFERAVALDPRDEGTHVNLGRALREAGDLASAIVHFRHAVDLRRDFVEAWSMASNALREAGRLDEALEAARQALSHNAWFAQAHLNEGAALYALGRTDEAMLAHFVARSLHPSLVPAPTLAGALAGHAKGQLASDDVVLPLRAIMRAEADPAPWLKLARALRDRRRIPAAIVCLERAISLARPAPPGAERELGQLLHGLGQDGRALEWLERAVVTDPDDGDSHRVLATLLLAKGRNADAEKHARRAIAVDGEAVGPLVNLGVALERQGRAVEASETFRRALALDPTSLPSLINLGVALTSQAKHAESVRVYRDALAIAPDAAHVYSNLLMAMHFDPATSKGDLYREHLAFAARYTADLGPPAPHANVPDPDRRLRIGYVSPDLRRHPVAHFLEPVLRAHDASKFEVLLYSDARRPDAVTGRLRRLAARLRETAALSDDELAHQIREDRIDVLFDLSGHTAHNRLLVFARKPAPVQVSWIGYFDTTGLSAIDYRLADEASVPAGAEQGQFVERVVRLPRSANCFLPPPVDLPVASAPSLRNGYVTFGCFNNPAKITRDVVRAFARILRSVESSRLILKYGAWADPLLRAQYRAWFHEDGVLDGRVDYREHSSMTDFLAEFADIDIALDPFPYSGETTALHTLWMGVPLVALEGETLVRRLGSRVLRVAGLADWIASDVDGYVELAVQAAADKGRLASLRGRLRETLARSPLLDHEGVTREVEAAIRAMWRTWCAAERGAPTTTP